MLRSACSTCGARPKEKLASAYWAWFNADGVRSARKQRLCIDCVKRIVLPLVPPAPNDPDEPDTCPCCGGVPTDDLDPIYLTLYLPKQEARTFEIGTDAVCASAVRIDASCNAKILPDRQGPSQLASETAAWDALGLAP